MATRLRRLPQATSDLDEIWLSLATENLAAAERLIGRLYDAHAGLAEFPGKGRARPELAPGLRSWAVGGYVTFYRTDGEEILIVRVLHGARDLDDLLAQSD